MLKRCFIIAIGLIMMVACQPSPDPGFIPIPYSQVTITSPFWSAKIDSNLQNGIPGCFEACDHSLENFDIAAGVSDSARKGTHASDSDVYKIIQGAAHALDHSRDPNLELFVDELIDRIGEAQEPDGYLYTQWSIHDLSQKWTKTKTDHELYCAGHLFEAAADYYEVTGKRKILDIATHLANHIDSVFGRGKLEEVSGHQEIELALIRLYEVTDNQKYLDLAGFFLDERGNPERIQKEDSAWRTRHYPGTPDRWLKAAYRQDHIPLADQREATGHAVRAAYIYRGMSDFARIAQTDKYDEALNALWNDIVEKRIYVTGSIGTAQFHDEGFGSDYNLPTESAYCETCSAIALMYWNQSMASLTGDSKFADLFEYTLYNGGISGGSSGGDRFFYTNPLEGHEGHNRQSWYEPGCCPSNYVRFIPMLDQFIYGKNNNQIIVNQYIGSTVNLHLKNPVELVQQSNYPWDSKVSIRINPEKASRFSVKLRIPGWTRGSFMPGDLYHYVNQKEPHPVSIRINEKPHELKELENGYLTIERKWEAGDLIEIEFPLDSRLVEGRPEIEAVKEQKVLTRGPVVYCLESTDNHDILDNPEDYKYVPDQFGVEEVDDFVHGIQVIHGQMRNQENEIKRDFTAIPYFSWRNRGPAKMRVWF